jgi:hypothetical protein
MLLDQLDKAEQKWQRANVTNYRITVTRGSYFGGPEYNTITVIGERVVTQLPECHALHTPGCISSSESPDDYSVPGLFVTIRKDLHNSNRMISKMEFDPMYGFPSRYSSDSDKSSDSGFVQDVTEFVVLP